MSKNKRKHDTISEEDYTREMSHSSSSPQSDSPGDSESDSGSEFLMGLNFEANEDQEDSVVKGVGGARRLRAKQPRKPKAGRRKITDLNDKETVVSSDLPGPWADSESPTNTH